MKRQLLTMLIVLGLLVCYCIEEAQAEPVLIEFTAKWCAPCKLMKPIVKQIEGTGVRVYKVDFDTMKNSVRGYKVKTVPTYIAIDINSQNKATRTLGRVEGSATFDQLRKILQTSDGSVLTDLPRTVREAMVHVNGSSGVILVGTPEQSLIGTAFHIVDGERKITIRKDGQLPMAGKLLKHHPGYDIALLSTQLKSKPFTCLASVAPSVGDTLRLHGYRGDTNKYQMKSGEVTTRNETSKAWTRPGAPNNTLREMTVTHLQGVTSVGGQSGGPVVNDRGKVIGFISSGSKGCSPDCENRGTSVTELEPLLQLCQLTDFPFPDGPIMPWRKKTEANIEGLQEAQTLPPVPFAPGAGASCTPDPRVDELMVGMKQLGESVKALEAIVEQERESYEELKAMAITAKELYEAGTKALGNTQTDIGKQLANDVAAIEKGAIARREAATIKVDEAAETAGIAKTLAEKASEATRVVQDRLGTVDLGLTEASMRLKEAADERSLLRKGVDAVKGVPGWVMAAGPVGIGLGAVSLIGVFVLWRKVIKPDLMAYLRDGDPLIIAPFIRRIVQAIPTEIDDNLVAAIDSRLKARWATQSPGATTPEVKS